MSEIKSPLEHAADRERLERISTTIAAGYAAASNVPNHWMTPKIISETAIAAAKHLIKLLDAK